MGSTAVNTWIGLGSARDTENMRPCEPLEYLACVSMTGRPKLTNMASTAVTI